MKGREVARSIAATRRPFHPERRARQYLARMPSAEKRILDATRSALAGRGRVVLAVSGGIDSMTLLDAARRVLGSAEIVVATFDHGTGDAATAAAALVHSRARELGLTCVLGRASRALRSEAELRDARWAFLRALADRAGGPVVTAHNADDQVETVLMRVMRGAGARGLAALQAPNGPLRPFVALSRTAIASYARLHQLSWVSDPSNDTPAFFRNRVRHDLLPALRLADPKLPNDLITIAERAAAWRRDVDAFVLRNIPLDGLNGADAFEVPLLPLADLPPAHQSVLWPSIVAQFGLMLDRRGIARLSAFAATGRAGSRIQLSGGWSVVRSRDNLTFSASSHVAPMSATIDPSRQTRWGSWLFRPRPDAGPTSGWSSSLPSDAALTVRAWEPGDTMRSPRGTIRKVKQLLSRAGVTGHKRAGWPVVLAGEEIIWVPGVRGSNITERLGTAGVPFICEFIDG